MAENTSVLVLEYGRKMVSAFLPNIVIQTVILSCGVIGNAFILYVYAAFMRKDKMESRYFIPFLSFYDLLAGIISIIYFWSDILMWISFESDEFCKSLLFLQTFTTLSSNLFLMVIALQRYLKICRPLKRQMDLVRRKLAVVVIVITGILLAVPTLKLSGVEPLSLTYKGHNISGPSCYAAGNEFPLWKPLYYGTIFFVVVANLLVTVALYTPIGCVIYKTFHTKRIMRKSNGKQLSIDNSNNLADSVRKSKQKVNFGEGSSQTMSEPAVDSEADVTCNLPTQIQNIEGSVLSAVVQRNTDGITKCSCNTSRKAENSEDVICNPVTPGGAFKSENVICSAKTSRATITSKEGICSAIISRRTLTSEEGITSAYPPGGTLTSEEGIISANTPGGTLTSEEGITSANTPEGTLTFEEGITSANTLGGTFNSEDVICSASTSGTTFDTANDICIDSTPRRTLDTDNIICSFNTQGEILKTEKDVACNLQKSLRRHTPETNFNTMFLAIIFFYVISYVPTCIVQMINTTTDNLWTTISTDKAIVYNWFIRCFAINHATNPFIYTYFDLRLRHEIVKVFRRIRCKSK